MLKHKYLELVLSGKKCISIRKRTRLKPGDLFFIHSKGLVWGIGKVEKVEKIKKSEVNEKHAKLEGMTLEELKKELDRIYGKKDVTLFVVYFKLVKRFDKPFEPEKKFYGDLRPREIAMEALRKGLFDDDPEGKRILELVVKTDSIRKTALKLGGLSRRNKVRAILRKAAELLNSETVSKSN